MRMRVAFLFVCAGCLTACATPVEQACEGKPNAASTVLLGGTNLLLSALEGADSKAAGCVLASTSKEQALALALMFRSGEGAPKRPGIARHIYERLVISTGGTIYVYSPPVGKMKSGTVIPVNTGPVVPGDARAMRELGKMLIAGEAGKPKLKQGWNWIRQAAAAGDGQAREILKDAPRI
jgi:TPR repeat protein